MTFSSFAKQQIPLFENHQKLKNHIAHISLCTLPTPIEKLKNLSKQLEHSVYIKKDNQTNEKIFGGNKPRKLEFLLAHALNNNYDTILTYGGIGSNHALASAGFAQKVGLNSILILSDQPNSITVKRNLQIMHTYNARMVFIKNSNERTNKKNEIMKKLLKTHGKEAY